MGAVVNVFAKTQVERLLRGYYNDVVDAAGFEFHEEPSPEIEDALIALDAEYAEKIVDLLTQETKV